MIEVLTFGEAMIRLSPPGHLRLEQTSNLEMAVGGAELSVAAGMARLGRQTGWVSRLPTNPLGRMIVNKASEFGVNTTNVIWADNERAGLYFVEYGAAPRPTQVHYDRHRSAFANIQPGMLDWKNILGGISLLHIGGITPALSPNAAAVQREALQAAKNAGCLVSYDLNYRAALWSTDKARTVQLPWMKYVDILITSLPRQPGITELISGLPGDNPEAVGHALVNSFGFKAVLITLRDAISAKRFNWSSLAFADGKIFADRQYEIETVDQLGGGDTCVAGFLTGYLEGDIGYGVRLGNAFSALTQTSPTDFPWPTRSEADALVNGNITSLER